MRIQKIRWIRRNVLHEPTLENISLTQYLQEKNHIMSWQFLTVTTTPRRKSIRDENLLEKAKKLPYIEARVIKIPIINSENKEDELILLTDLPEHKFNTFEIAGLYKDRWEIEVNYDRLKNKMEIENYSGKL